MLAFVIVTIVINKNWKENCCNKASHVSSQDESSRVIVIQGNWTESSRVRMIQGNWAFPEPGYWIPQYKQNFMFLSVAGKTEYGR